jgi:predicted transcriptional regulator
VRDKNGLPEYVPFIDPATQDFRKLLYELFVEKCWSVYRITKHFNALRVDGWDGWTQSDVRDLLWSASAVGVFVWNRTRNEYDHEQEKWVVVPNLRKDWVVYFDPKLAIVPMTLWKAARKKLTAARRKSPLTGRKHSRNQKSATTLFSGTLFCGYCGRELLLCRSTGKYKVMGCTNGWFGAHGCELSASKSTRIIEKCLLGFLLTGLLKEEKIAELVDKANDFLAQEANKPRVETAPIKASIRQKEEAIDKLLQRIAGQADENLCQAYDKRICSMQKEVNELKAQLHAAESQNAPPPPPLDVAAVKALLSDLRGVFSEEIPAAAEAIRALTGPITIRQEKIPGKKRGAKWIATFTPDLLGWLRRQAKAKDYPDSITLEYLSSRIWIRPETVEVWIDHTPKYEKISAKVAELTDKGASVNTIAGALGETWATVSQALDFAKTGKRPKTKPSGKRTGEEHPRRKKVDVAEVVRLRDERRLSLKKIARQLGISQGTAVRAYDRGNPQAVREAAERGQKPKRGRYTHLGPEVFERIQAMLTAGQAPVKLAAEVGCGVSTVYRVRRQRHSIQAQDRSP